MLKILIEEANCSGDILLAVASLYGICDEENQNLLKIEEKFGAYVAEAAAAMIREKEEDFEEYVKRIFSAEKHYSLPLILVAAKLQELRMIRCPFESWEEDIPSYNAMERVFARYINDAKDIPGLEVLWQKLQEQLEYNRNVSYRVNKTTDELYTDWDDDHSEPF